MQIEGTISLCINCKHCEQFHKANIKKYYLTSWIDAPAGQAIPLYYCPKDNYRAFTDIRGACSRYESKE